MLDKIPWVWYLIQFLYIILPANVNKLTFKMDNNFKNLLTSFCISILIIIGYNYDTSISKIKRDYIISPLFIS